MYRRFALLAISCAVLTCGRSLPVVPRIVHQTMKLTDGGRELPDAGSDAGTFFDAGTVSDAGPCSPGQPMFTFSSECRGYSWVLQKQEGGVSRVGNDMGSNAYAGDTPCTTALPLLCVLETGAEAPAGFQVTRYSGWFSGEVAITRPVPGICLGSRAIADALCEEALGAGFRLAEHHDGQGNVGWGFGAFGTVPAGQRFWTAINDQQANPWNSVISGP